VLNKTEEKAETFKRQARI